MNLNTDNLTIEELEKLVVWLDMAPMGCLWQALHFQKKAEMETNQAAKDATMAESDHWYKTSKEAEMLSHVLLNRLNERKYGTTKATF
jgi:hypothetical protein